MKTNPFNQLRKIYGNHTKVAKILEISPRHYRRLRATGKLKKSTRVLMQVILQTGKLSDNLKDLILS